MIRNRDGNPCTSPDEVLQCWRNRFESVLNIRSRYVESAIESVHQYPVREDMSELPTEDEDFDALSSLKGGKAEGKNGILPEIATTCGVEMMDHIVHLLLLCGENSKSLLSGGMQCWLRYRQRATSHSATTGMGSLYLM